MDNKYLMGPKFQHLQNIFLFSCLLGILSVVYFPAITGYYVHYDAYRFLLKEEGLRLHVLFNEHVSAGRFFGGIWLTFFGWFVNSVSDLKVLRFINLVNLSLWGVAVIQWLRPLFPNLISTLLFVVTVLTLPSFQVLAVWSQAVYITIAFPLAAFSAVLVRKTFFLKLNSQFFLNKTTWSAMGLLFLSLGTYQPSAMIYWGMAAAWILIHQNIKSIFLPTSEGKNSSLNFFLIGFLTLMIYLLVLQIFKPHYIRYVMFINNPYGINIDFLGKLKWFIEEPVLNVLNLWNIFPRKILPMIISGFIFLTIILIVYRTLRRSPNPIEKIGALRRMIKYFFIFIGLMILSYLPNLIAVGNAPWYRCTASLSFFTMLILVWALMQWLSILPKPYAQGLLTGILLILCLYGVVKTHKNSLNYRFKFSVLEFLYLKQNCQQIDLKKHKRIHMILARAPGICPQRYHEYCNYTTQDEWNVGAVIEATFKELKRQKEFKEFHPQITWGKDANDVDESTYVIDMTNLIKLERSFRLFNE